MNYKIVTDSIEVRNLMDGHKPRYVVRGTAGIANKKHIYKFFKQKDGNIKTLKSMFTPHCIESIKKQSKNKTVFVDIQHEMIRDSTIKAMVKDKLSDDDMKRLDNMLKRKQLPLIKLTDIDIFDDKLDLQAELNPMFREVDDDSKRYFDAVWYSLENKYLTGISANWGDFKYAVDENGDMVIDDVDILGYSLTGNQAEVDNDIYEVAIRAMEEGVEKEKGKGKGKEKEKEKGKEGENKMAEEENGKKVEEEKNLNAEKAKLDEERKTFEAEKEKYLNTQKNEAKMAELDKQKADEEKLKKSLDEKAEALKKAETENGKLQEELNSVKGKVKQTPPPAQNTGKQYDEKFYKENIKEITAEHDESIALIKQGKTPSIDNSLRGFSRMVNLQAKANSPTAGLDEENAKYVKDNRLLRQEPMDIVTPRPR